ncbi:MAG TPA: 50S ribosomal protein L9 [Gemmatimonadales bacterium]|jgi:large subunit ribosomal protein L9|nr:50S ribosomal protein L9 [Gemmatimonadales bacterium]
MEVILREDVQSLGKAGELVKVRPGYARNYLLPQGLAYEATEGNRKRIEAESKARTARAATDRAEAETLAAALGQVTLTLARKAGEGDRLFGSITAPDIAEGLAKLGHTVDRRRIELGQPIKSLGEHRVTVRLPAEVHAEVRITVVPE